MNWIFFLLTLTLQAEWRDANTVRIDWATPGAMTCIYVDDAPTGRCGEFGSFLYDTRVTPGQTLEARLGDAVYASTTIPASPYPKPLTATRSGLDWRIQWQTTDNNDGCVVLRTTVDRLLVPCAPSGDVTVRIAPGDDLALLVNSKTVTEITIPPTYIVSLPLVVR